MSKCLIEGLFFDRFVHHYDAHATTDALRFNLLDPEGNINLDQALHITVLEDHTAPRIVTNMGLTLSEDDTVPITRHLLSATDVEIDSSQLMFSVSNLNFFHNIYF